jgi:NTP pyrophosphatase (non-canonical NTP hydrolase)
MSYKDLFKSKYSSKYNIFDKIDIRNRIFDDGKKQGAKEELESVLLDVKYISQAFNESDLQAENMINDLQKRIERRLKVLGELK